MYVNVNSWSYIRIYLLRTGNDTRPSLLLLTCSKKQMEQFRQRKKKNRGRLTANSIFFCSSENRTLFICDSTKEIRNVSDSSVNQIRIGQILSDVKIENNNSQFSGFA